MGTPRSFAIFHGVNDLPVGRRRADRRARRSSSAWWRAVFSRGPREVRAPARPRNDAEAVVTERNHLRSSRGREVVVVSSKRISQPFRRDAQRLHQLPREGGAAADVAHLAVVHEDDRRRERFVDWRGGSCDESIEIDRVDSQPSQAVVARLNDGFKSPPMFGRSFIGKNTLVAMTISSSFAMARARGGDFRSRPWVHVGGVEEVMPASIARGRTAARRPINTIAATRAAINSSPSQADTRDSGQCGPSCYCISLSLFCRWSRSVWRDASLTNEHRRPLATHERQREQLPGRRHRWTSADHPAPAIQSGAQGAASRRAAWVAAGVHLRTPWANVQKAASCEYASRVSARWWGLKFGYGRAPAWVYPRLFRDIRVSAINTVQTVRARGGQPRVMPRKV